MSAPITDQPPSFISSSGHVDGLGRRLLAFDRETGAILERLHLRPELAAFEPAIRLRVDQLSSFDDERFARPASVERDPATGDLTVLSEFVAGSHLSDLLETAEEGGLVPGVDVALGFLLETLPAISSFHAATGCSHGLIAPTRMLITPAGQVVFLDPAFGLVIERLGLSKARLWLELGIAAPQGGGAVRLDVAADIAQVALSAVMLVIGRRLREHEYPDSLPSLLMEVVEVAQIRGSSVFATSLQRLLQRALPLTGRRPFRTADELANEIRLLLRREIGTEVCRQALIDFTDQMDAQVPARSAAADPPIPGIQTPLQSGNGHAGLDLDQVSLDALDSIEVLDDDDDVEMSATGDDDAESDQNEFEEVSLDPDFLDEADLPPPVRREPAPEPILFHDEPPAPDESSISDDGKRDPESRTSEVAESAAPLTEIADPWSFDRDAADRVAAEPSPAPEEIAALRVPEAIQPSSVAPEPIAPEAIVAEAAPAEPPPDEPAHIEPAAVQIEAPTEDSAGSSSRRKKRQQKSARARKDKLRSATDSKAQPPAKPAETRPQGGWIVNPDRAAAFAPAVVEATTPQAPAVIGHAAPPAMPVYAAPVPQPIAVPAQGALAIPMPVYGVPSAPRPVVPPAPAPAPIAAAPVPRPVAPASSPVRIKAEPPSGYAPPRSASSMTAMPYVQRGAMFEAEAPRGFPWKLALAVLLIVGMAVVVGRMYIPSTTSPDEDPAAEATPAPETPAVVVMPKVETGDITIATQPAGARVRLDGKPVGQSPLRLADVPVGRHTLTLSSSSGEVTRTVRVAAGSTTDVDIPIFSGWVAVFAPVVLDVAVNGRSIGTTEQNRLMLPPGRHELTLTNKDLGYSGVQQVEVEPGEVRSLTVDPRGPANFNAIPWAEVWLDGQKLGDTPLANVRVPLGLREFVFKHPQFGERRVTASIRADQPSAIGVDFTRPQ